MSSGNDHAQQDGFPLSKREHNWDSTSGYLFSGTHVRRPSKGQKKRGLAWDVGAGSFTFRREERERFSLGVWGAKP